MGQSQRSPSGQCVLRHRRERSKATWRATWTHRDPGCATASAKGHGDGRCPPRSSGPRVGYTRNRPGNRMEGRGERLHHRCWRGSGRRSRRPNAQVRPSDHGRSCRTGQSTRCEADDGRRAKAASGRHAEGAYPYGYTGNGTGKARDKAPDADEQKGVDQIVELRREGNSYAFSRKCSTPKACTLDEQLAGLPCLSETLPRGRWQQPREVWRVALVAGLLAGSLQ